MHAAPTAINHHCSVRMTIGEPGNGGEREEHQRDGEDRAGFRATRTGQTTGTDPVVVGAANAVAVVVGVVHTHLQTHRDGEAGQSDHPVEYAGREHGGPRADDDGRDREGKRARTRGTDPVTGRRGLDGHGVGATTPTRVAAAALLLTGTLASCTCHEGSS